MTLKTRWWHTEDCWTHLTCKPLACEVDSITMESYFFTHVTIKNLLFKGLNINDTEDLIGACAVTFIATIIFEALKVVKLYISLRLNEDPLSSSQNLQVPSNMESASGTNDEFILLSSLRFPVTVRQIRVRKIILHILDTLSHMINYFYGYLLMLLVMTFSIWLTISVVVGCGVGYLMFGAVGQVLQLRFKQSHATPVTACNDDHHQAPPVQACAGNL